MRGTKMDMKRPAWFTKVRGSYLPLSWQGFVLYVFYVAYIIVVPVTWYAKGHYLWPLLVNVIPAVVGAAVLAQVIAAKTSE